ncbi:glycosyl hydrolase 115 family protein [Luteolibacter yonseiensis]|uniref:Glycosyl hydrolase 115 family protein n=1 Tax=Luteolibacter yonseiensis TaxID=1144680 RepID=A0A934R288_9BACT|nr:glycosyl hydrolase 115 family protein [Luteolibacter yonseiensis]MBK1814951.1 glycosyl hydrolase 115 family protein [Luteolibacter yonseiensis]
MLLISGHALATVDLVNPTTGTFPLVSAGKAAPIVLPEDAPEVVKIAARDLAADIAAVSGITPEVLAAAPAGKDQPRVELMFSPDLKGKWEAFRLTARPGVLTISGSDRRGLAFGIYEISSRIGVSPWRWWADVPVTPRPELHLSPGDEPVDQPAVRYRGIFINDEDWGLQPWAAKNFEPEVKDIGPGTYTKIFELLLRLRANTIWPAMHECTKAFHLIPGNAAAADAYSIVLGSSHAEPMLRSNTTEWTAPKEDYNYIRNPGGVLAYWEERVKERSAGESLFTIGMRGIHDSAIVGPKSKAERISTVERIFADQRGLLGKYLGKGDPSRVGQIFVPYKEVLEDYDAGMKVPEDVSIMWTDDNFGYIRRHATPEERRRSGGFGIYYHASYLGAPLSWLWVDTLPPALVWSEMMRAYEHGANGVWIVNAGDIKNTERSMEFFLDLAWHADRTDPSAPERFMRKTAERDFGKEHAAAVADVLNRLHAINFSRKAEHLQWHSTGTPYKPTELNEAEIEQRLGACAGLLRDSAALAAKLPPAARDAYFQLVGYPVAITEAVNERYFRSELARADSVRGRAPEANKAAAIEAGERIRKLTSRYNNGIAKGKWRGVVTENGVSAKSWTRFQPSSSEPPAPTSQNICPPAPSARASVSRPSGVRAGDFVEAGRVVSIDAGHFTTKHDGPKAGWRVIPGLGRTGSAVTVLPSSATIKPDSAPGLEYRFHTTTKAPAKLHVRLVPTHPLVLEQGLRLAVSIDNDRPIPLAVNRGFSPKSKEWSERVLSNATEAAAELPKPLNPGWHTLRLVAVDAGVVVDKIVLDLGGLEPSYDGPAETRVP